LKGVSICCTQALAKAEGFAEQIERIKDYEVSRELDGGGSVNKGKKMKKICAASYVPSSVVSPRKKEPLKTSDQSNLQDISTPGLCHILSHIPHNLFIGNKIIEVFF